MMREGTNSNRRRMKAMIQTCHGCMVMACGRSRVLQSVRRRSEGNSRHSSGPREGNGTIEVAVEAEENLAVPVVSIDTATRAETAGSKEECRSLR